MLNHCIEKQSSKKKKQARILITETHGTWKVQNNAPKKPCAGVGGFYFFVVKVKTYRKGWTF